jgi:hypothetical protein
MDENKTKKQELSREDLLYLNGWRKTYHDNFVKLRMGDYLERALLEEIDKRYGVPNLKRVPYEVKEHRNMCITRILHKLDDEIPLPNKCAFENDGHYHLFLEIFAQRLIDIYRFGVEEQKLM